MREHVTAALLAGALATLLSGAAAAQAPSGRTFVSGAGTDTGTCPRTAPCRNFAYAIGQTPAGGEIVALDPGGYGPVTITKAISIIGPGTGLAQINGGSGNGIEINAGSGDEVSLRGIEIDGGSIGINLDSVGRLILTDSVIRGANYGIQSFASSTVVITDSTIADSGDTGIYLAPANLVMTRSKVSGNVNLGVSVSGTSQFIDCTIVNSPGTGISIVGSGFVKGTLVSGNNIGVTLASYSTVRLDTTTITNNGTSTSAINTGGTIISYGNNNIFGNGGAQGAAVTKVSPNARGTKVGSK